MSATIDVATALEVADWRRQTAEIYARTRETDDPLDAWHRWQDDRRRMFTTHPQSPIPAGERDSAHAPAYFPYDPSRRVLATVVPHDVESFALPGSTDEQLTALRFGTALFELDGAPCSLAMFWLRDYAGGIFVSFRDATSGSETYGAGRYLLDTAKGADLGMEDGRLVLDSNFAYQPSCSYDPRWSCPLPPRENWLPIPIAAGERLSEAAQEPM